MSDKTNFSQLANLQANLGLSPVASRWVGLLTTDGADGTAGTECADANYVRILTAWNAATVQPTDVTSANTAALAFPNFAVAQSIVAYRVYDTATPGTGNAYYHKAFPGGAQIVNAGNGFLIPSGSLTIQEL